MSHIYYVWPPKQLISFDKECINCTTKNPGVYISIFNLNYVNAQYICADNFGPPITKNISIDALFDENVKGNWFMYHPELTSFTPPQTITKEEYVNRIQAYINEQKKNEKFKFIGCFEKFDGIFHFGVIVFRQEK